MFKIPDGFLIVFSLNNLSSFNIDEYIKKIKKFKKCEEFPVVLVGNKCDLVNERLVDAESVYNYIAKNLWNVPYIETSAKTKIRIDDCFVEIVREIRKMNSLKTNVKKNSCNIL